LPVHTERAVSYMLKRVAATVGVSEKSWLTGCGMATQATPIDHGAALPVVQATLGHGNISVTSAYLHARPDSSSGLHLDPGVFLR
jgi:integrase/recombinase XerD